MARKKGSKCVSLVPCKTIYDMDCVGVRVTAIAKHYKMSKSTVSYIIKRLRINTVTKKMGRPRKLTERGMRLLKKYVTESYFESLHVLTARFNAHTKLHRSIWTVRRYIKRMDMGSYIAVQKPFLSKKNISARIVSAEEHRF